MPTWREDVLEAMRQIGGVGTLADIYSRVTQVRAEPLPSTWQAVVRRELEYNSSDSVSYQQRHNLFRSVNGIGRGVWALREIAPDRDAPPDRLEVTVNRIIRDTKIIKELKALYEDACQLCGLALSDGKGSKYSEGHHVRPLGRDHQGTDTRDNVLILCPNCHASCDLGFRTLDPAEITWRGDHRLSPENLAYHNQRLIAGSLGRKRAIGGAEPNIVRA